MSRLPKNLFIKPELDNGNLAVVNRKGDIIGMLWWQPGGKFTVHLEHLEVQPDHQNQGIGEAMLRKFLDVLPTIYPHARHLSGNATSQGAGRLLTRVFGSLVNGADMSPLPGKSPKDWIYARKNALVRYSVRRATVLAGRAPAPIRQDPANSGNGRPAGYRRKRG